MTDIEKCTPPVNQKPFSDTLPQGKLVDIESARPTQETSQSEQFRWLDFVMSFITFVLAILSRHREFVVGPIIAILFSGYAYVHHGDGKYGKARKSNFISRLFWILSLILVSPGYARDISLRIF